MDNYTQLEYLEKFIPDNATRNLLLELINGIPTIAGLFDGERRLIIGNTALIEASQFPNFEESLYLKPGELFQCSNAVKAPDGCGSSEGCGLCGAFNSIKESRAEKKISTKEFRILTTTENGPQSYNYRITSSPLHFSEHEIFLVSIEDINGEKRKAELEKIFYHDVLNSVGSLFGVINLMKKKPELDPNHLSILETTYNILYDTIVEQKQISSAEEGQLSVKAEKLHTQDLLIENMLLFQDSLQYRANIKMSEDTVDLVFTSDQALLSRIIINMIKNAMEASSEEETITVGAENAGEMLRFWVHNPGLIPADSQLQIFVRSYSTKGSGRGLGTFGMKLLGEEYLKGEVGFKSSENEGTTFWIELPLN